MQAESESETESTISTSQETGTRSQLNCIELIWTELNCAQRESKSGKAEEQEQGEEEEEEEERRNESEL